MIQTNNNEQESSELPMCSEESSNLETSNCIPSGCPLLSNEDNSNEQNDSNVEESKSCLTSNTLLDTNEVSNESIKNDQFSNICEQSKLETQSDFIKQAERIERNEPFINLLALQTIDDLRNLGADRLKLDLQRRQMKCGGTLDERTQRLWSIRGLDEIPKKLLAKQLKKDACIKS